METAKVIKVIEDKQKQKQKLMVCVPCYGGVMHGGCSLSLLELNNKLNAIGWSVDYQMLFNESLISRARNYLAHKFMTSDCSRMLFIDSDIQFQADDVIRMLEADVDVIGGLYSKKEILWERIAHNAREGRSPDSLKYFTSGIAFWPHDDFLNTSEYMISRPLEVKYIGTGMMLIKRCVFDKMKETWPDEAYLYQDETHHCFFDTKIENKVYLSEDYYFCNRWREIGGKIHAALWARTTHFGNLGLHTDLLKMAEK
jgi:hypothetical protein